jgi:hypothetical protein
MSAKNNTNEEHKKDTYSNSNTQKLESSKNLEHKSLVCTRCTSAKPWLTSYLIDHLKLHLATYTEIITDNEGKTAEVRIYYCQALQMLKIGAHNPAPAYVIRFSHLTSRLQTELNELDGIDLSYVLKQVVSRIFEDINIELYHNSISRMLRIDLQR